MKRKRFPSRVSTLSWSKRGTTHPRWTAERQRSRMTVSDIEHSPPEMNIMMGVLVLRGLLQGGAKQGTRFDYKLFRAPVLFHDILAGLECQREVFATACPSDHHDHHDVQESVYIVLAVMYQHVFSSRIEQDNTESVPSYADRLPSCNTSDVTSEPEAVYSGINSPKPVIETLPYSICCRGVCQRLTIGPRHRRGSRVKR